MKKFETNKNQVLKPVIKLFINEFETRYYPSFETSCERVLKPVKNDFLLTQL